MYQIKDFTDSLKKHNDLMTNSYSMIGGLKSNMSYCNILDYVCDLRHKDFMIVIEIEHLKHSNNS